MSILLTAIRFWFMSMSSQTYRRDVNPFESDTFLVHEHVIPNLQKRCQSFWERYVFGSWACHPELTEEMSILLRAIRFWFMSMSSQTYRRDVNPFDSDTFLVHEHVIPNLQKRCQSFWQRYVFGSWACHPKLTEEMLILLRAIRFWFMSMSSQTYRRDVNPFDSDTFLVREHVIPNLQKRCQSFWERYVFGSWACHPKLTEEISILLRAIRFWFRSMSSRTYRRNVNPFDSDNKGRLFVVDVSINWPSNRNWQTKVLDSCKARQLNLLTSEKC